MFTGDNLAFRWHFAVYKTILSSKNGMNIYRGCLHGCIYCDSRSACYQMNHDFEDIEVKRNAPQILDDQLRRRRLPCMIGTGSMCDPYIPLDDKILYTRQCLEVIEKHGFGVTVLTKSVRVLRDLDVLKRINEKAKAVVQMTLTTYDENLCRVLEPNVSTTAERFHALEVFRDNGISTVVWLCPILPFINDTEENLRGILDYCIRAKVTAIMDFGFGVTLREGDREYFYKKLDGHFPGIKQKYIGAFGNAHSCSSPKEKRLTEIFTETCNRYGIIHGSNKVFAYLNKFPDKSGQMSLFDMEDYLNGGEY
ncbi:MAG: radical SAM protein [Clostridiales bacterium]|nr:radical SAM protein [Clostridiales bacterium]